MYYLTILLMMAAVSHSTPPQLKNLEHAKELLNQANMVWMATHKKLHLAKWKFLINMSDQFLEKYLETILEAGRQRKTIWTKIKAIQTDEVDAHMSRQIHLFSVAIDHLVLSDEKLWEIESILSKMQIDYAKVYEKLTIKQINERNNSTSTELQKNWIEFNDAGTQFRKPFQTYVNLMNEAATLHNLRDASDMWLNRYEIGDVRNQARKWWTKLLPFYKQFHAYLRYKLRMIYGDLVPQGGGIPDHLLWITLDDHDNDWLGDLLPYPDYQYKIIAANLAKQGYTTLGMCRTANDFMMSLNFTALPKTFWINSIFDKAKVSHPINPIFSVIEIDSSVRDVRAAAHLTLCPNDFFKSHWVIFMAHMYQPHLEIPFIYQHEPIPGFYLGIAEVLVQFTKTRSHLTKLGLIPDSNIDFKNEPNKEIINRLFHDALVMFPYLHLNYLVDLWRWDVFAGKIGPENYNCAWWKMVFEHQGVEPPVDRSERNFDIGMKIQETANKQQFPQFLSGITRYQIHRTLCAEAYGGANSENPLHECDIYGSFDAGGLLKEVLQLGRSKNFQDIFEVLTGSRNISIDSIFEYYKPLINWLKEENAKNEVPIGWDYPRMKCSTS